MKKFTVALLSFLLLFALVGCGASKDKAPEDVVAALKDDGYTNAAAAPESMGVVTITASKNLDVIFGFAFADEKKAKTLKGTYDLMAQGLGQTCKQSGRYLYYGSATGLADFEKALK